MNNLYMPLNDEEIAWLEEYLLNRIDEEEAASGETDEGIFEISGLDGFFTAIICSKNLVMPSTWLPALWGDYKPEWANEAEFEKVLNLLMRHMNEIAGLLLNDPDKFEPLFLEREVEGRTILIVDEWCVGFERGMSLDKEGWDDESLVPLLSPIHLFGTETGWDELKQMSGELTESHQQAIPSAIREIYSYNLSFRDKAKTLRRSEPKIGRNDPCPCGSGKKYKVCCGAPQNTYH